jgi:hypothetical protein
MRKLSGFTLQIHPHTQWHISTEIKRLGHGSDHSLPSSVKVKNERSYTPPLSLHGLIHWECCTTEELCSSLSTCKGSVMAIIEELGYFKICACWAKWMLTGEHRDQESNHNWSFAPMTLEVRTCCHRLSWEMNSGPTTLYPNQSSIDGTAPYDITKEEVVQECAISWINHGYSLLEWERC